MIPVMTPYSVALVLKYFGKLFLMVILERRVRHND
jgi:hypothetical protein